MPKFFNTLEAQVGNFTIQNSADDKDIIFNSDNGSGGLTESNNCTKRKYLYR